MSLWKKFETSFIENNSRLAFCINGHNFSYSEFTRHISGSQQLLRLKTEMQFGDPVGVVCRDSIETFAAIFAIWFSGGCFVPLHPNHPVAVNNEKIRQAGIRFIFDSEFNQTGNFDWECICNKEAVSVNPITINQTQNQAYILFTSGSTGKPKGVPISELNLDVFINGFLEVYPDLTCNDRFLQTYDLTSDAAFTGYLIPLLLGASVFTIPSGGFKYLSIVKLLHEQQITWTQFTPSVLSYLQPYFKSLRFESLKHSHFGGEALPCDLVEEWAACVPNAEISNIYGPTETTITCTINRTLIDKLNKKVHNGIISIGKPLKGVKILIIDDNGQLLADGQKGELCIGGEQVMAGYLGSVSGDKNPFFVPEGSSDRYYRSGDLVIRDEDGFLLYCGRIDDQLKVSGYRVEPAEIELAVSLATNGLKSKAFGYRNKSGTESIVVFIEKFNGVSKHLEEKLRELLPSALIPEKIIPIGQFQLNTNGKVDKHWLFEHYSNLIYE